MVERDDAVRVRARALRDGLSVPPRLPLARPDPGTASARVERERGFSPEPSRTLSIFAAENGISIHTMAQAAWAFVLSRYCGVPDAVFFAPDRSRRALRSGGDGPEVAVRRIRVPEEATVRDWLRGIQAERDRLRLAPPVRLDSVLQAAGWERAMIESCLDCREFASDETGVRALPSADFGFVPLALRLEANPRFRANLSADGARFLPAAVERLLEHFTGALDAFVREPDRPLATVEWMSASERERILVEFNGTDRPYPSDRPAHALIEEAVDRDPSALAVESPSGGRLTFGELEERANRLAHRLRAEGVGPDVPVGIFLERSPAMVVALLGVLKAGGAYLPLDPAWPAARIAFILADARAPVVLTEEALARLLSAVDSRVLRIDAPGALSGAADRPRRASAPDDLAYVIYTSGSTGKPKGVLVTHRGLVNYLVWSADAYRVAGEPAPVHSPLAFDLTVTSLLTPLSAGRAVEMIPDREGVDGLVDALRRRKDRSVVKITPAHLEILASRLTPEEAKGCARVFVIGGEALRGETLAFWVRNAPEARYVNEYGPTETVVGCCVEEVTAGCWTPGPVPIGRPIANTRLYVLDARMRPVPVGVPGELFIGGDGLARGYLGREDLTGTSFVANPLPEEKGERLYRTGDLARYREDGSLEYLGRADDQVKIRGYRIELGEIENLLRRHPSVRQAAVAVAAGRSGEPRLVGYIAAEGEYAPRREELRGFLAESLPEYMIPGVFVEMDELPLTSNGKVDRRALPPPPEEEASSSTGAPPRDETQRKLSAIWSEVLGIPEIGVDRNFFDLGGHSVLAARIFAKIEDVFGVRLPLAVLVESPTIEKLAGALAGNRWENAWSSLVPLQANGTKPPLYCFHPIGGNIVGYVDLARRLGEDQPLWGLQAVGLDGKRPRHKSIDEMADHYVAEIREFQPDGPYYLAGSSFGGTLAFEAAQRLRAQGAGVAFVGMFDTWGPDYRRREDLGKRAEWMARTLSRIELHLGNFLAAKGPGAKARYLASKAARVAHDVGKRARRFARRFRRERPASLARTLARVEQSALKAKKVYAPTPYAGKITLFRASRQPSWFHPDPRLGWGRLAAGELEIHEVPGHHGALVHEPRVAVLAVKLEECLARAREEWSSAAPQGVPAREVAGRRGGVTA